MPDDDRWAAALDELHRRSGRRRQGDRVRARVLTALAVVGAVEVVGGALLLALLLWRGRPAEVSTAGQAWGVAAGVVALGAAVVGWGSAALRNSWAALYAALGRDQRAELAAHVRGARPVRPRLAPLARERAVGAATPLPLFLALVGLSALRSGLAVGRTGRVDVLDVLLAGVWLALLGVTTVRAWWGARFLRVQPDQPVAG